MRRYRGRAGHRRIAAGAEQAIQERHADHQQAVRERTEQEVFHAGLHRDGPIAVVGGHHEARDRGEQHAHDELQGVGGGGHHHGAEGRQQQHGVVLAVAPVGREPLRRAKNSHRSGSQDDQARPDARGVDGPGAGEGEMGRHRELLGAEGRGEAEAGECQQAAQPLAPLLDERRQQERQHCGHQDRDLRQDVADRHVSGFSARRKLRRRSARAASAGRRRWRRPASAAHRGSPSRPRRDR